MNNKAIIIYDINQMDDYTSKLEFKLNDIRELNEIHNDFLSGNWNTNIKYRSSFDKNLNDLQSKYYQDKGK